MCQSHRQFYLPRTTICSGPPPELTAGIKIPQAAQVFCRKLAKCDVLPCSARLYVEAVNFYVRIEGVCDFACHRCEAIARAIDITKHSASCIQGGIGVQHQLCVQQCVHVHHMFGGGGPKFRIWVPTVGPREVCDFCVRHVAAPPSLVTLPDYQAVSCVQGGVGTNASVHEYGSQISDLGA